MHTAHVDLERRLADAASRLAEEVEGGLLDTQPILDAVEASEARLVDVQAAVDDMVSHARNLERRLSALETSNQNHGALEATVASLAGRIDHLDQKLAAPESDG